MKTIESFEIYREGKLDRVALYKKRAYPAFLAAVERFDTGIRTYNEWLDNLPSQVSRMAQVAMRELDREAGRR